MTPQKLASLPLEQRFRLFCQWLGNQPAHGEYCFYSVTSCALCQFGRSLDGVGDTDFVSAGARNIHVHGRLSGQRFFQNIDIVPESVGFYLHRGRFGIAYDGFARPVGLPRRGWKRFAAARLLARYVKHSRALAA